MDWLPLPEDVSNTIDYHRIAASLSCLPLGVWFSHFYRLEVSLFRLLSLVSLMALFQTSSNWILVGQGFESEVVAGYAFFPFMIITMIAIFPLIILGVADFATFVILVELITQL